PQKSPWNIKIEMMSYHFEPVFPDTEAKPQQVVMGAYGATYFVADKGELMTFGISYHLPIDASPLEAITFYNNYGYYNKRVADYESSHMNVLGGMLTAGLMYIYIDSAWGYNHPWLGPEWTNAFSEGSRGKTTFHMRFNINMGLYF